MPLEAMMNEDVFNAEATVTLGGVGLSLEIKGEIELE
jgi:hypothetical protein